MCRLLYVKNNRSFQISDYLTPFANIAKNSKEFQGHGWGCAYRKDGTWQLYHNILPIWEDDLRQFGRTGLLLAHARSAFEDRDVRVENNMPFRDDKYIFIFNGELRGVKIKESGRIGAEKIFNYVKRFDKGDMLTALRRAIPIIEQRTDFVKAMNIIIADEERVFLSSVFNADPDYFALHRRESDGCQVICSEPLPNQSGWQKVPNHTITGF
jgi:glutamine amidotransferase